MTVPNIDLTYFKEKLINLQAQLHESEEIGDEAAKTVDLDQSRQGRLSRMDAMQAQQMAIQTNRMRELKLQRIEAALQRIEKDEFGACLVCGTPINPARLEFDPTSFKCIKCAE